MSHTHLPTIAILSLIMVIGFVPFSFAEHFDHNNYVLEGIGFGVIDNSVQAYLLDMEFTSKNNKITSDGVISTMGVNYAFLDNWKNRSMYDGRYLLFSGNAENSQDEKVHVLLFGKLIGKGDNNAVYSFSGTLKNEDKKNRVSFAAKVNNISNEQELQSKTDTRSVQIDILEGAYKPGNARYYSPPRVEITPNTTIIWKNNDSVSHRIMSGIGSSYPGNPFTPDGIINSGDIMPGETFEVTITELGITRFFDTKYSWMDGVILSKPETSSITLRGVFPDQT